LHHGQRAKLTNKDLDQMNGAKVHDDIEDGSWAVLVGLECGAEPSLVADIKPELQSRKL
jgi:hypothetical protein